jgi:hypothetical protein
VRALASAEGPVADPRAGARRWVVSAAVVGLVSLPLLLVARTHRPPTGVPPAASATDSGPPSAQASVAELRKLVPEGVDRAEWSALVDAVDACLTHAGVAELSPHTLAMIRRSLEALGREPYASAASAQYHVGYVRWALPRFLEAPPTPEETATLRAQITAIADDFDARREALGLRESDAPMVEAWREGMLEFAATFLMGSSLHPLSRSGVSTATAGFEAEVTKPGVAGPDHAALARALAAAMRAIRGDAARPLPDPFPEDLTRARAAKQDADRRLAEEARQQDLQRFHAHVVEGELTDEAADAGAWSLLLSVGRCLGGGTRGRWSCRAETTVGKRGAVPVWVSRDAAGAVRLRTPDSVMQRSPQRGWLNADICITEDDVTYIRTSLNVAVRCPLEEAPAADAAVTHFTDQQWGQCLASEAKTARIFWKAVGPFIFEDPDKTGAADLDQPIGLFPFCSSLKATKVVRDQPGEPLKLLSAKGEALGTVRVEGKAERTGSVTYPPTVTIDLEPRTVPAATTMRVSHGRGEKPTEERWTADIPAQVRRVVVTLNSPAPGVVFPASAEAFDEKGERLCRIEVSEFKLK